MAVGSGVGVWTRPAERTHGGQNQETTEQLTDRKRLDDSGVGRLTRTVYRSGVPRRPSFFHCNPKSEHRRGRTVSWVPSLRRPGPDLTIPVVQPRAVSPSLRTWVTPSPRALTVSGFRPQTHYPDTFSFPHRHVDPTPSLRKHEPPPPRPCRVAPGSVPCLPPKISPLPLSTLHLTYWTVGKFSLVTDDSPLAEPPQRHPVPPDDPPTTWTVPLSRPTDDSVHTSRRPHLRHGGTSSVFLGLKCLPTSRL